MTKSSALRDRVAAGILEVAATVLADRGDAASMSDVADTAGVGRATLYRYFPSREALLQALAEMALEDLCERIAGAELETVGFEEGIARLARATATANLKFRALFRSTGKFANPGELESRVRAPIREFFRRAAADGALRGDLDPDLAMQAFIGLLDAALGMSMPGQIGVEATAATITTIFLHGTVTQQAEDPQQTAGN